MTSTDFKPGSIDELVTMIYEDNLAHFEFMENMNGGDCDCSLHVTMQTIIHYWGGIMCRRRHFYLNVLDITRSLRGSLRNAGQMSVGSDTIWL
jgi:hypothetical protein